MPDEIHHIDELLNEYVDREDELLDALKAMGGHDDDDEVEEDSKKMKEEKGVGVKREQQLPGDYGSEKAEVAAAKWVIIYLWIISDFTTQLSS